MDWDTDYNSTQYRAGKVFEGSNDTFIIKGRVLDSKSRYVVQGSTGDLFDVAFSSILRNITHNPYKPTVYGWGILGSGSTNDPAYCAWKSMIRRCYYDHPTFRNRNKSYGTCKVFEGWKYFTDFKVWWEDNYIEGFVLDKDIKSVCGVDKIYSPPTCMYIPEEINRIVVERNSLTGDPTLPTGVSRRGEMFRGTIVKDNKKIEISSRNKFEILYRYYQSKQTQMDGYLDTYGKLIPDNNVAIMRCYYMQKMRTCGYEVIGEVISCR
jgi:hypothetical protein